jgi:small subunit ribosomal protein S16
VLGTFNPRDKKNPNAINVDRLKYWIGVGAKPTESVVFTLKKAGIWAQVTPVAQVAKS